MTPEEMEAYGYMTPEEMEAYGYLTPDQLAEQGFITQEEFQAGLPNIEDYDQVIADLQTQLAGLEDKYANAQSQYDADATKEQIDQTRNDLDDYFRAAQPSGPRTGSTSVFEPVTGGPMANLIAGQRASRGDDPYAYALESFTPSYGEWEAPISADEYGSRRSPGTGTFDYPNPFYNQGGVVNQPQQSTLLNQNSLVDQRPNQTNQGILGALSFQTNVAPFQDAFRPNVKRS